MHRALAGVCVVAMWLGASSALALDPRRRVTQYGQDAWSSEDGLPQNTIFAQTQTRDGYLWLGTWEGLVRFDGVRFTVFDRRTTPELRGPSVQALAEDAAGVLWVGTEQGLVAYENGRFRRLPGEGELAQHQVKALVPGEGALWMGTTAGLVRVPLSGEGPWRRYTSEDGLPGKMVLSLAFDRGGTLWVGTPLGLARMVGGKLRALPLPSVGPVRVSALREGRDGTLWVGTSAGLFGLKDGKVTRYGTRDGLPHEAVTALWEDAHGNLWVGMERGGVARRTRDTFSTFGAQDRFADMHVLSLFEDRDGGLWLGTFSNGLMRLRDGAFVTHGMAEGLSSDAASTVLEDGEGALWVGTLGGGLQRMKDGAITRMGPAQGFTEEGIRSLTLGPDGTLWVGTYGGAFRWDGQRFTRFGREQGLPHDLVWSSLVDSRGDVWFGTGAGVARLHEGAVTVYGKAHGVPHSPIIAMVEDADGVMWMGSHEGLVRSTDAARERYAPVPELAGDSVMALYADPHGELWMGTNRGLGRLKDGRFQRFTTEHGLHEDSIFNVLPDGDGQLWTSGNRGVTRLSRRELEEVAAGTRAAVRPTVFDQRDGMRSGECNGGTQPSGWRGRDGRLWFATIRGVVAVDPRQVRSSLETPEVRIEEVRVQGRPVSPTGGALEVAPGSFRDVEVRFTAFARGDTARLPFRYRLVGHDEAWLDPEGRRSVKYSSLPPGTYRFQVTAASRDGVWAEPPAEVELRLQAWFHQTAWFYTLCVFGTFALIAAAWRWRVGRLERRERWLQQKVEERTRELAQANQELEQNMRALRDTQAQLVQAGKMAAVGTLAAGVGHEINNPLAYIVSNLEFASAELAALARRAQESPEGLGQRLRDMDQALRDALHGADRVRRIVRDLKTFSRGDEEARGPVDLHAVLDSAAKLAGTELRARARVVKDYGQVPWVEGNEARLAQVFLNLLINAAQALPEGRAEQHEVRLVTRLAGERVVAEVHDTGSGIPPEVLGRIFDPFFTTKPVGVGTGLGLALCHAFLTGMGGEIGVESRPGRTVFRVTLPASRSGPQLVVPEAAAKAAPAVLRGRVLVVDDDPLVASSLRRSLAREHEVEVMTSARQALEKLAHPETVPYDVVLCDLMMPDMTGMELHEALLARSPLAAGRMVFVTGGAFTPSSQAFLERVGNVRLEKPFEPEKLRELVRSRVLLVRAQATGQAA
jgi:ligand-binding sensor domain-containing protein/signal transduction histidine kinase/CheY-like chemotaxis protein